MTATLSGDVPQRASSAPGVPGTQEGPVVVASATIPTRYGPFRCVVFGPRHGASQGHVAMVRGDVAGDDVLVRVHSECMTGEVFASVDCDCASDLDLALRLIANEDRGVVVYLRREGADGYAAATALLSELGVLGIRLLTGSETRRLAAGELDALSQAASPHPGARPRATDGSAAATPPRPSPGQPSFTADSVHPSTQDVPFAPSGASA